MSLCNIPFLTSFLEPLHGFASNFVNAQHYDAIIVVANQNETSHIHWINS